MFGFCIWFLPDTTQLDSIIQNNARNYNTDYFTSHVTIKHSIPDLITAINMYDKINYNFAPMFLPKGNPYITTAKLEEGMFYAVQSDLSSPDLYDRYLHVSLAYSMNKNTIEDVQIQNRIDPFIGKYIAIVDCRSTNPNRWKILESKVIDDFKIDYA